MNDEKMEVIEFVQRQIISIEKRNTAEADKIRKVYRDLLSREINHGDRLLEIEQHLSALNEKMGLSSFAEPCSLSVAVSSLLASSWGDNGLAGAFPPPSDTGVAAPKFVPGAIEAMWLASKI